MDDERKGDCGCLSQRQRFYVELKPGQTAIVSWKKLVKDSFTGTHFSSSTRALDVHSEDVQCRDLNAMSERLEYKNSVTISGHKQQSIVETTCIKGADNNDPLSTKHWRRKNVSTKAAMDKYYSDRETSVMVKDHQLDRIKAFAGDAMTCMKNVAGNSNKHRCPPYLNVVMDASVSPSKTKLINLPKPEKVYLKRRKMEVGVNRNSSGSSYNSKCRELMDGKKVEVSSKIQHNDKSCQRKELVNVVAHGFRPPLKHLVSMKGQKAMIQRDQRMEDDINRTKSSSTSRKLTPPTRTSDKTTNSTKQSSSKGRNMMESKTTSQVKDLKQEQVPKKTNLKVRFSLKNQHVTRSQ